MTWRVRSGARRRPPARAVPIIAISAAVVAGERGRCIAAGMDDMLTKPISLEDLARHAAALAGSGEHGDAHPCCRSARRPAKPACGRRADTAAGTRPGSGGAVPGPGASQHRQGARIAGHLPRVGRRRACKNLARTGHDPAAAGARNAPPASSARTVGAMRYAELAQALEQRRPCAGAVAAGAPGWPTCRTRSRRCDGRRPNSITPT